MEVKKEKYIHSLIAGVKKAGTSSLYHYLGQHNDLEVHKTNEIPYFVEDHIYERGWKSVRKQYYGNVGNDSNLIAKSVGVCYYSKARKRLKNHNPECNVIMILRDPVERAYSSYWYTRRRGGEDRKDFDKIVKKIIDGGEEKRFREYISRGRYAEQIKIMKSLFGDVKVIILDDLKDRPIGACKNIFEFIGIEKQFTPNVEEKKNESKDVHSQKIAKLIKYVFRENNLIKRKLRRYVSSSVARKVRSVIERCNETDFTPPPMSKDIRCMMAEYYEPYTQELESMLDRSLDHWTRAPLRDSS